MASLRLTYESQGVEESDVFDVVIRKMDTLPLITRKVYLDGSAVDLTGYTFNFEVTTIDGATVFDNPASVPAGDPVNDVQYQWTDTDSGLVTGGVYFATFKGDKAGDNLTFPNNRPLSLMVTDSGSWEYSYSGDPTKRPIDRVRFLLGDKNMDLAFFTDSEILFLLSENGGNAYFAAADLAVSQAGSYSSYADKTVGPLSIRYGEQANRWTALSKDLRTRGTRQSGAKVVFTGQNALDRGPIFKIGMNDNPESTLPPELGGPPLP